MMHQDRTTSRTRERERDQTHSYRYIPSAPRVNYSLLVMESIGMMKIATGDDFPPPAGCQNRVRLVFGGYRALRRRNSRSRFISGAFYIYRNFGAENKSGGSTRSPQDRRAPRGGRERRPPLWRPRGSSGPTLLLRGLLLVHKNHRKFSGQLDSV